MKMHQAERIYADMLERNGIKYVFPVPLMEIGVHTKYRPDFYLPESDTYVEVVGSRQAYSVNKYKYNLFKDFYRNKRFIVVNPDGTPFPPNKTAPKLPVL